MNHTECYKGDCTWDGCRTQRLGKKTVFLFVCFFRFFDTFESEVVMGCRLLREFNTVPKEEFTGTYPLMETGPYRRE